jgi:hypothetical protein
MMLFKTLHVSDPSKYRPVSLFSLTGKTAEAVLLRRSEDCEEKTKRFMRFVELATRTFNCKEIYSRLSLR